MTIRVLEGDCRTVLATLPDASVQCCVTSPPYFGLRDYGVAGQIGLEPTLAEYIAEMIAVFREVRRVLREDGTCWLNVGDSYARDVAKGQHKPGDSGKQDYIVTDGGGRAASGMKFRLRPADKFYGTHMSHCNCGEYEGVCCYGDQDTCPALADYIGAGLKPKDLMMVPARLAIALQDDGWWLRSDIIWHKPNPMPESVTDRPTSAHEHVFLLTKSARYYYDADAVAELSEYPGDNRATRTDTRKAYDLACLDGGSRARTGNPTGETRNLRNVWTIATQPFPGSHFATMPPDLAERCIKAGTRPGDTVLDPFGGAGTTALVADRLQRNAILIELNPEYAAMARERVQKDAGLFGEVA